MNGPRTQPPANSALVLGLRARASSACIFVVACAGDGLIVGRRQIRSPSLECNKLGRKDMSFIDQGSAILRLWCHVENTAVATHVGREAVSKSGTLTLIRSLPSRKYIAVPSGLAEPHVRIGTIAQRWWNQAPQLQQQQSHMNPNPPRLPK